MTVAWVDAKEVKVVLASVHVFPDETTYGPMESPRELRDGELLVVVIA